MTLPFVPMVQDPLDGALEEVARQVGELARQMVEQILDHGPADDTAVAVAEVATELMEQVSVQLEAAAPPAQPIACKKGCSTCCHVSARTDAQSVLRLVRHVNATWSEADRAALLARIDAHVAATRDPTVFRRAADRPACPLLVDHACSVHQVRPIVCRAFNSFELPACIRASETGEFKDAIPSYSVPTRVARAVQDNVTAVLAARGLHDQSLPFSQALQRAFAEPAGLGERWLKGEPFMGEQASC